MTRLGTSQKLVAASQRRDNRAILEQAMLTWQDFWGYYGPQTTLQGTPEPSLLEMADITSSTGGILNKIFGPALWAQLNVSAQLYAAMPKLTLGRGVPYGWRAKTAFASTALGGVAEGTVPTAVVSTYIEVSPTIKEHATQMRVSGMQQDLAAGPDDAYGRLPDITAELAIEHAKEFERALHKDIDTLASNNFESVDRLTASSANQAAIGWTAGDEDIHGIDRSASTWADAEQDAAATARTLTLKLIDSVLRKIHKNGGYTTFLSTGWDTWESISDLVEPRLRAEMGVTPAKLGRVGSADVPDGMTVSTFIGNYQGRPIVPSDEAVADASEISRMYFLDISNPEGNDKPRVGIDVLRPTQMYLAGERSGTTPQSISFIGDSALAVTRHQLGARFFKAQGQLRDTTAP